MNPVRKVTKIILPSAGLAKRLRPLTNRIPKALVLLNGKPLIAYILREAEASGITEAVIVASPQHKAHFKKYIAAHAKDFPGIAAIHLRIQEKPLGDGHAVLQAADLLRPGEPVAVRFSDDIIIGKVPVLTPLLACSTRMDAPALLLERVPKKSVSRWGIVEIKKALPSIAGVTPGKVYQLTSFVEKPAIEEAPSCLAVMGGYVLTPAFLSRLKQKGRSLAGDRSLQDQNDVLRLADVFRDMLSRGERIYGYEFSGKKLDCGTLEGFAKANDFVHQHPRLSPF